MVTDQREEMSGKSGERGSPVLLGVEDTPPFYLTILFGLQVCCFYLTILFGLQVCCFYLTILFGLQVCCFYLTILFGLQVCCFC